MTLLTQQMALNRFELKPIDYEMTQKVESNGIDCAVYKP